MSDNVKQVIVDELPSFNHASSPSFMWNDIEGESFTRTINNCYLEIIHWKRNFFMIPSGKAGTAFVHELAQLFRSYSEVSAMEGVALKATMVLPSLLLQKSYAKSETKEHVSYLNHRLEQWHRGDVEALMVECRSIQQQLNRTTSNYTSKTDGKLACIFEELMFEGKVKATLRLITQNNNSGALHLDMEIKDELVSKHPSRQPAVPDAILTNNTRPDIHPVVFNAIDGNVIRESALGSDGAAGPSGLDVAAWKRLCCSFKSASVDLCDAIALVARRICSSYVDPSALQPFTACRLIALDKCPGVRPIGIGEVIWRIIGKAIIFITKGDIQSAVGSLQLCAGQEAGCEAAVHAMKHVLESPDTDAIILVDATNAFNTLNREVALRNIHQLCPSIAKVLINTYRKDAKLYINGESIASQEGTTQGDPLAMAMYGLAVIPLIRKLTKE